MPKQQAGPTSTQQAQADSKPAKLALAASSSHKVTEYFPIRRSGRERKSKAELQKEQNENIEARLQAKDDTGLGIEVVNMENKGRGVKVRFG